MAFLRQLACTPESSATSTATANAVNTQPRAGEVPAVCVDVIDHGDRETPWGYKPQISLVFEYQADGNPKWFTRTYNNYPYAKSALTKELKNWLGIDISGDNQDWDLQGCVGEQATLKTTEVVSKAGNRYKKIDSVNTSGEVHVQASGTYERNDQEI